MVTTSKLTPVIRIDENKCNNCYACIAACHFKARMDGSGKKLFNADICIGCGNCIDACSQNARRIIDGTPRFFFDELERGTKTTAVIADDVRRLFDSAIKSSGNIPRTLTEITGETRVTPKRQANTDGLIAEMATEISGFADTMAGLISTLGDLSAGSIEVTLSLASLQELTSGAKAGYTDTMLIIEKLRKNIDKFAAIARMTEKLSEDMDNLAAITQGH